MLVHNLTSQTTYHCGNCMFMSEAISFKTVLRRRGRVARRWQRVWPRGEGVGGRGEGMIYVGRNDLSSCRKWAAFRGKSATRHRRQLPYLMRSMWALGVKRVSDLKGGPIKSYCILVKEGKKSSSFQGYFKGLNRWRWISAEHKILQHRQWLFQFQNIVLYKCGF